MRENEFDYHVDKIIDPCLQIVAKALFNKVDPSSLDDYYLSVFRQYCQWSEERIQRIRSININSVQRKRKTRELVFFSRLYELGKVSDEFMILYGLQGVLPQIDHYETLSNYEKSLIWIDKMDLTYGPFWRQNIKNIPNFLKNIQKEYPKWKKNGF